MLLSLAACSTLFPYTTLFRSARAAARPDHAATGGVGRSVSHPLRRARSEEHTSELQSRQYLVCRLLLEKKKWADVSCGSPSTVYLNMGIKFGTPLWVSITTFS